MFASIRIALTAGLLAAYALSASGQAAGGLSFEDLERLKNAKCTACHDTQKRNVGPSWREIATRYSGDRNALKVLAQRVREGSSGNWGSVPMPPNFLPWNEDAESLVRVVLGANAVSSLAPVAQSTGGGGRRLALVIGLRCLIRPKCPSSRH